MSIFYSIDGSVKIHTSLKTEELILELENDLTSDIELTREDHGDGTETVSLAGGMHCSYSTAVEIETDLRNLGPHTAETGLFSEECDGERGQFWVGKDEDVKEREKEERIGVARVALANLKPDERESLLQEFLNPEVCAGLSNKKG